MNQPPEDLDGWPTAEDLERELAELAREPEWPTEEETAAELERLAAEGEADLEALAALTETDILAAMLAATPRRRRGRRAR